MISRCMEIRSNPVMIPVPTIQIVRPSAMSRKLIVVMMPSIEKLLPSLRLSRLVPAHVPFDLLSVIIVPPMLDSIAQHTEDCGLRMLYTCSSIHFVEQMVNDDRLRLRKTAGASRAIRKDGGARVSCALAQRFAFANVVVLRLYGIRRLVDKMNVRVARAQSRLEREQLLDISVFDAAFQDFTFKAIHVNDNGRGDRLCVLRITRSAQNVRSIKDIAVPL